MADRIQTTPRNKLLGLLADSLSGAYDYAQRPDPTMPMGLANPVLGLLADALPLKAGANVLDDLSYGQAPIRGTGMTTRLTPDATELAMAAAPFPKTSGKAALAALGAVDTGASGLGKAAIVWHGSPHKFDRFDASKIGTGEGAQAYGHGIYTAEAPGVANSYRRAGETAAPIQYKGQGIMNWAIGNRDAAKALPKETQDALAWARDHVSLDDAYTAAIAYDKPAIEKEIQRLVRAGDLTMAPEGHLYKVDLPDNMIARMLDWDRPFSQQAPDVRKALQDAEVVGRDDWLISGMRGSEAYKRASFGAPSKLPLNQADDQIYAAERLRRAGIPGIRYLDGGSRNVGAGTSNFVVFPGEENALTILERNGRGLLD